VEILGMSADSVKAQKSFCDKQEFPFSLLSDPSKETIKAYDAWGPKKFMGREYEGIHRYSYLIDEKGIVERTYPKVKTKTFAQDVLADIR
jgi:peroxiredoxin Q/BCP